MANDFAWCCPLLSKVLENKVSTPEGCIHVSGDVHTNSDTDDHPLLNQGFICYFLNFLRESSAPVLRRLEKVPEVGSDQHAVNVSSACHPRDAAAETAAGNPQPRRLHQWQMMSTPKLCDDIMTPISTHLTSCPLIPEETTSKNVTNSFQSPNFGRQKPQSGGKGAHRAKNKPLSLSDFLSPDAGSAPNSGRKRQKNKNYKLKNPTSAQKHGHSGQEMRNSPSSMNDSTNCFRQNSLSHNHSRLSACDAKSPVNPLYSEASRSISFNIDEEFPQLSVGSPQVLDAKPSRRIKPTAVATHQNSTRRSPIVSKLHDQNQSLSASNPFISASPITFYGKVDLRFERDLLKQKQSEQRREVNSDIIGFKMPVKSLEDLSPVKKVGKEPDPTHVVAADKIARLSELYSYYINSFLVPSVVAELQFVIEILSAFSSVEEVQGSGVVLNITGSMCNSSDSYSEDGGGRVVEDKKILSTVSNAVHFTVQTIHALVLSGVISILTHSLLSMLAQNHRVQCFLPSLQTDLYKLAEDLAAREKVLLAEKYASQEKLHSMCGVPFEAETDDRSNFASDKSFHAFRKHRDSFYSLFREYEEKRQYSNFSVRQNLGGKIKALVSQVIAMGTNRPFTRLFASQMLLGAHRSPVSVQYSNQSLIENSFGETNRSRLDLVASLRHGDPEKFRRLQSRFVTASTSASGRVTDPVEEQCHFYKEFVSCADSYTFNTHLHNELRKRIADIETQLSQQILDDVTAESVNIPSISSNLSQLITSARILGRFWGFLTFHPYDSEDCVAQNYGPVVLQYVTTSLERSITNGHQILTVPWTTEYLKSVTFQSTLGAEEIKMVETLFLVYKKHSFDCAKSLSVGDVMITLAVSSVLELAAFPDNLFYQLLKSHSGPVSPKNIVFSKGATDCPLEVDANSSQTLDEACGSLVSLGLIYDWHQSIKEIRAALLACNTDAASKSTHPQQPPRKIKPSTEVKLEENTTQRKEKRMQSLLEDHFFRGQPSSLKRTVSFVAERCASNCVKHIRSVSMLQICAEAEETFLQRWNSVLSQDLDNSVRLALRRDILGEIKASVTQRMHSEAKSFCERAAPRCMEDLCSCETAKGVLEVATKITKKKALASVHSWLAGRLNELVTVSVKARLTKVSTTLLDAKTSVEVPVSNSGECDTSSVLQNIDSLSSLLHLMKEYIVKLTFSNAQGVKEQMFFHPCKVDPALPTALCKHGVSVVLHLVSIILSEEIQPTSFGDVSKHSIKSMQRLVSSSPHLKNCLVFTAKELTSWADHVFGHSAAACKFAQCIKVANFPTLCN